jgi:hypothetical protein
MPSNSLNYSIRKVLDNRNQQYIGSPIAASNPIKPVLCYLVYGPGGTMGVDIESQLQMWLPKCKTWPGETALSILDEVACMEGTTKNE